MAVEHLGPRRPGCSRRVRLIPSGAGVLVTPQYSGTMATPAFESFMFPHVPLSLLHWASALCCRFAAERAGACLVVALLHPPLVADPASVLTDDLQDVLDRNADRLRADRT
jgi:hypothetical protein